ncbi:GDSL-like lipase/acylhydrolase [Rhizoctonia solani 123E]|uniref:GDSL-like lipase/acylhydrolase n=1 Tax=Rhizoctonia solani 123E TaxID=1423351 RepID=A0A074RNQ1_9AGAM|nr:GDSL-like lipase/acylhydrolase [Rhizoctonia solani 123E]
MLRNLLSSTALLSGLVLAASTTNSTNRNDGIHLAIGPTCGRLTSTGNTSDLNAGLWDLKRYKTIVSFGDSFTAGGVRDGSPLAPAVITPPSPKAGGRTTNGPVWIEYIANDTSARFMDYAVGGAVTNKTLWPSKSTASDFVEQVGIFLNQSNSLDPTTTLYTVYFGINDVSASHTDGAENLPAAAQVVLDQIKRLVAPPTNARSFLVTDSYGRGSQEPAGDAYKKKIFNGLAKLHTSWPFLQIGYADFGYIWNAVLKTEPGYAAFGYNSPGACALNSSTIVGACEDPDHTFYWIPGHPSKQTHRIMGDYVELAMKKCRTL